MASRVALYMVTGDSGRAAERRIFIQAPFSLRERCKELPGSRWHPVAKMWHVPATTASAGAIARAFKDQDDLVLEPEVKELFENAVNAIGAQQFKHAIDLPPTPTSTEAWIHQRRAFAFAKGMDAAMLAMDMGCLAGDSIVHVSRSTSGMQMTMAELHRRWCSSWADLPTPVYVRGEVEPGVLGKVQLLATQHTGYLPTVRVTLADGRSLRCTPDHEIQTPRGLVQAQNLIVGDDLVAVQEVGKYVDKDGYVRSRGVRYAHREQTGVEWGWVVHHKDGDKQNNHPDNLEVMTQAEHARIHAASRHRDESGRWVGEGRTRTLVGRRNRFRFGYQPVVSVEWCDLADVYDLTVEASPHTYVADGFVVSNTGKSLTAIALLQEWDAKMVAIMCPKSVVGVWPKQFDTHALDPEEWYVLAPTGRMTTADRAQFIAKGIIQAGKLRKRVVVVINYEAAWRDQIAGLIQKLSWDAIILDESHRIKSAGGKQSMFVTSMRKRAKKRLALTGTPMPHSPMDLYAQYRFLDPGIFGTSKNRFQNRYAITESKERRDGRGYQQITGWQNMTDFNEKFSSIAFVISKDEALPDLPEKMPPIERTFQLSPKGVLAYAKMAQDFVLQVDEGTVVAANALSKMLRLRQIAAGHSKTDTGETVTIDNEREKALKDVLEDLGNEPVVVFAAFHADLDAIRRTTESLGLRYGELSGRQRDGLSSDATMAPDIDVLGCQLKSGGVGIDLTRACYAIYYTVGYELGDYDQSQDRLHRPGQTRPVRYIHLVADNAAIDRIVYAALKDRKNVVNAVLNAAKGREL